MAAGARGSRSALAGLWVGALLLGSMTVVAQPAPDPVSDAVGALAGEFRVDETGAATYSVPLYTVPGTAGVVPAMSLTYSSQGGEGPLGKGWSIGGLSAIQRCRKTQESGDGADGGPITFTTADAFCLDGQRLLPAPAGAPACPAVSGMVASGYRTELESFQRVCAYKLAAADASPRFFSVERTDGSVGFYGDRMDWVGGATPPTAVSSANGFVKTTSPGKTNEALTWAQTRFRDSTGNYIDYTYFVNPGGSGAPGEHLPATAKYTGKVVLPGQTGTASAPYAEVRFVYAAWPSTIKAAKTYLAGGEHTQSRYLARVESWSGSTLVRAYLLGYGTTASGANHRRIASIRECTDTAGTLCLPATTFSWASGKFEFATADLNPPGAPDFRDLVSYRFGDIDGDGRQDIVWFKNVSEAGCSTSRVFVAYSVLTAAGQLSFTQPPQSGYCTARDIADIEDSWHLLDYNDDGRDDLMVAGAAGGTWSLFAAASSRPTTTSQSAFVTGSNLIAGIAIPVPSENLRLAQLADLDGNGLLDVIYPRTLSGETSVRARLMERSGSTWVWGAERELRTVADGSGSAFPQCDENVDATCYSNNLSRKLGSVQLNDFNGDGRSDPLFAVTVRTPTGNCAPNSSDPAIQAQLERIRTANGIRVVDRSNGNLIARGPLPTHRDVSRPLLSYSQRGRELEDALQAANASSTCYVQSSYLVAYAVDSLTSGVINLRAYQAWTESTSDHSFPTLQHFRTADMNGDGLTDMLRKDQGTGTTWTVQFNTGRGFWSPQLLAASLPNQDFVQLVDVNGDGRADVVYPHNQVESTTVGGVPVSTLFFKAMLAQRDKTFAPAVTVAGFGARACESGSCVLAQYRHLFADFDGDGAPDFVRLGSAQTQHLYTSRAASRFQPRDVITKITNGLGAITEAYYLPLTNNAVYRRDSGSRNAASPGRGSPVQDLLAPMYVVARSRSSAPLFGSPTNLASIHYRYTGARVQAGGRGLLGFREITSFGDVQHSTALRKIATSTTYRQDFPYIGRPSQTRKWYLSAAYATDACFTTRESNTCFTPTTAFPAISGTLLSQGDQLWVSAPAFAAGTQAPLFVHSTRSEDKQFALNNGAQTARVVSTYGYDSYGNVTVTGVETYAGTATTPLHLVSTSNSVTNDTAAWRLGRLTASTVTQTRGSESKTRSTAFTYDLAGAKSGFLTSEKVQPGGGSALELKTFYTLDAYGNRTHSYTCSSTVSDAACKSTAISFQPTTNTTVQRYARTSYDSLGRFPTATYAPFWNGSATVEVATQTVLARNLLGDVIQARDANGVDTLAVFGAFGRPYYSWSEAVAGATPGTASQGVESWTTYRFCGTAANQVSCPVDAKFRSEVRSEGAPTQWRYHDVLGREVLNVKEAFQSTDNQRYAAVCTYFDRVGRGERSSTPFFLTSVASDSQPSFASNAAPCTTALWAQQRYDALNRPLQTTHPDNSTDKQSYSGLKTTYTDQNARTRSETRNALGEIVSATDAAGLTATYAYYADGTLKSVSRNAGRGAIVTSFSYDTLGRKNQQVDPDAGTWTYTYNAAGEVIEQRDGKGNRVLSDYDARGRVWRRRAYTPTGTLESTATFVFDTATNGRGALHNETISGSGALTRTYSYDGLSRLSQRDSLIDGKTYREATQYDTLSRPYKVQDATGRWAKTEYNARGYVTKLCDSTATDSAAACSASVFHLQVLATDARGNVVEERRGGLIGPLTQRSYEPYFGRIEAVCAGSGCALQSDLYQFDAKGNLVQRERNLASPAGTNEHFYRERFQYDAADRLVLGWNEQYQNVYYGMAPPAVNVNATPPSNLTFYAEYDKLGNLCRKTSWSTLDTWTVYQYAGAAGCGLNGTGGSGTSTVGQGHKLASLAIPQYGLSLVTTQDANGNHIGGSDGTQAGSKTYTYTAQNQANAIYQGSASSPSLRTRFWYGPDGSRYKRQDDGSAQTGSTTTYLGGVERIATGSAIKWRRPIGGVVLQEITGETTSSGITVAGSGGTSYQLYTDHLGSVALWVTLSGSTPTVVNRFDYAPHGEPRPTGLVRTLGPATTIVPWRGFTGHEHIDALSTIHMNGRIYDPLLGRFLQPDPIVQQAYTPQNWNPYSYVLNNPLSFTDPSGYSFVKKYWRQIVAIVVSYVTYGAASNWAAGWAASATTQGAFAGAVSGFAGGAISSGSLKGGLQGAFSGAVFGGIGGHYGNRVTAGRVAASGAAGGVLAELQGGKFGHGFVSAGLATAAAPYVPQDTAGGTVVSALIGGTVSAMTGGKFANGAVTAAFSYAIGRMAGSYLDRQQGANADKNSRDVEVLTKQVRRSFSAARQLAMSALDDYCSAQGGCAPGGSSVDFSAVDFKFDRKLFFGDESSASVGLTGGYVDRRSYSPPSVVLYAGGIAFQGNGTGPSAVAEVLLHEFMHVTPAGTAISQSYWQSGQSLPYLQRPHEIDAFNFAKEVMKYAH